MVLGMIPDCDLSQVSSAGNAAGTGARIALLDNASRKIIEDLVRRVEKIETAIEPKFQAHFVEAMGIPHSTAAYPEPAQGGAAARAQGGRAARSALAARHPHDPRLIAGDADIEPPAAEAHVLQSE